MRNQSNIEIIRNQGANIWAESEAHIWVDNLKRANRKSHKVILNHWELENESYEIKQKYKSYEIRGEHLGGTRGEHSGGNVLTNY